MSKILLAPRDCCGARVDTSVRLERSGQNDTSAPVPSSVPVPVPSVPLQTQVLATSAPVLTPERSSRPVRVQDCRVTFNGKGNPVAFLERVEELCDSDGVDADQLLPHLPGLLQGEAAAWFRNNRQRWCDWKGFVTDFRLFYFPVSYQEDLEVEISRRLQRPTEPVTTYLTELQTLLRRHGNLQPEQQLSWMYRNLLPEYRLYLKRPELTDAATLLRSVRELEAVLREQTRPTENRTSRPPPQRYRPAGRPLDQPHQNEPPHRRLPPRHQPQDSHLPPPCVGGVDRRDTSATSAPGPPRFSVPVAEKKVSCRRTARVNRETPEALHPRGASAAAADPAG
jgi:hypothetical protein